MAAFRRVQTLNDNRETSANGTILERIYAPGVTDSPPEVEEEARQYVGETVCTVQSFRKEGRPIIAVSRPKERVATELETELEMVIMWGRRKKRT